MLKKCMAIVLSIVMVITMIPVSAFTETKTFSDMPNNWSTAALQNAVGNGLLSGYGGKILPEDNLTRAQMATIINRAFGAEREVSLEAFTDVMIEDWYYSEMARAVAMETFQGSGNRLNPNEPITREEVFVVITRALSLEKSNIVPIGFDDLSEISPWAIEGVYALVNKDYIKGLNGKLNPRGNITRAEFAQVMDNILKEYINKAGEHTINVLGNAMINTPEATLTNSKISGDLVIGDGVGQGNVVLDNVTITGRLIIRGGGENSVIIKGDSKIGSAISTKIEGTVRIYMESETKLDSLSVEGKSDVIVEGNLGDIIVSSNNITVWARKAIINKVIIQGNNSRVVIGEDSSIEKLVLLGSKAYVEVSGNVKTILVEDTAKETIINIKRDGEVDQILVDSPGILIQGIGKVKEVQANKDNVIVKTKGTKVIAAKGTKGVMAGGKKVKDGDSEVVGEEDKDDMTYQDSDKGIEPGPDPRIPVNGIAINKETVYLTLNKIERLIATIIPNTATNKNIIWKSSDENVATVVNGEVKGVGIGKSVITAITQDGGYIAECMVIVEDTDIVDPPSIKTKEGELFLWYNNRDFALTGENGDLDLVYRIGEDYNKGSLTFNLPEDFEANENDTISISSGSQYFKLSDLGEDAIIENNGKTVSILNLVHNRIETITLKLKNRVIDAVGTYLFSAFGDKDGSNEKYSASSGENKELKYMNVVEGKSIKGKVSLPNNELAPESGISIRVSTEVLTSIYRNFETLVFIPEGKNSSEYSIRVSPNNEYSISYEVVSDNYTYVKKGYYNSRGTVASFDESEKMYISNENIEDIELELLSGNKISGVIKLPNDEKADESIYVSISARSERYMRYETTSIIERGNNSVEFEIVVPNGNFTIMYDLYGTRLPYVENGYFNSSGTTPDSRYAENITINSSDKEIGDFQVLKGNKVSGTITLPNDFNNDEGTQVYLNFMGANYRYYSSVLIPENESTVDFEIYVATGDYLINYSTSSDELQWRGYYKSNGITVDSHEEAGIISVDPEVDSLEIAIMHLTLSIENPPETINVGQSLQLRARYMESINRMVWSSDNPYIATVDNEGVLRGIEEGITLIKVKDINGISEDSFEVTVVPNVSNSGQYKDFRYRLINQGQFVEIIEYTGVDKIVTIPSHIGEKLVTSIGVAAFMDKGINSVKLPETLKRIGERAFSNNRLTSISIPLGIEELESYAFQRNALVSVELNEDLKTIGNGVFSENSIKNIDLPENLERIGYNAFRRNNIQSLTVPRNVKEISDYAFADNQISQLNLMEGIENLGYYAFSENKLTSLTIPKTLNTMEDGVFSNNQLIEVIFEEGLETIGVGRVRYLFENNRINKVWIPSSVTSIGPGTFDRNQTYAIDLTIIGEMKSYAETFAVYNGYTFLSLDSGEVNPSIPLENENFRYRLINQEQFVEIIEYTGVDKIVTIPSHIDEKLVTSIGVAAFMDKGINSVKLPETLKRIGERAFSNNRLTSISIPLGIEELESYAFQRNALVNIELNDDLKTIGNGVFSGNSIKNIDLPESLERIGYNAFSGNNIQSLIVPSNVKEIGDYAFLDNQISQLNLMEGIENLGYYAFSENKLTSLTIPKTLNTMEDGVFSNNQLIEVIFEEGLETIGVGRVRYLFENNRINKVWIPSSVTSIGPGTFDRNQTYAIDLTIIGEMKSYAETFAVYNGYTFLSLDSGEVNPSIPLENENFRYRLINQEQFVEIIEYTGVDKIVTIPSHIDEKLVTSIGVAAFMDKGINSVKLPETLKRIGERAFSNNRLTSISIPLGIEELESYAFQRNALVNVELNDDLKTIGNGVFSGNSIKNIDLPESLERIGYNAFSGNSIESLIVPRNVKEIGDSAFADNQISQLNLMEGIEKLGYYAFAENKLTSLTIPKTLNTMEDGVFSNNQLIEVIFEEGLETIGVGRVRYLFENNRINKVWIPSSVTSIGPGTFDKNQTYAIDLTIIGEKDSYAEVFAANNGYSFQYEDSLNNMKITREFIDPVYSVYFDDQIVYIDAEYGLEQQNENFYSTIVFSSKLFNVNMTYDSENNIIIINNPKEGIEWTIDSSYFYDKNGFIYLDLKHLAQLSNYSIEINLDEKEIFIR